MCSTAGEIVTAIAASSLTGEARMALPKMHIADVAGVLRSSGPAIDDLVASVLQSKPHPRARAGRRMMLRGMGLNVFVRRLAGAPAPMLVVPFRSRMPHG
ncbi:hypothetical protein GCM10009090_22620 [[Pseudomonas] boreopolis]|uniref:Uncharacterized protein n=1 Tax=Xanthomonas boreopolis TaxID=86183 RepID=A0A919F8H5_9XANT|nr:hypothetical protein GCM10009090_22620 [[Pseudomonas] boreopolis]